MDRLDSLAIAKCLRDFDGIAPHVRYVASVNGDCVTVTIETGEPYRLSLAHNLASKAHERLREHFLTHSIIVNIMHDPED